MKRDGIAQVMAFPVRPERSRANARAADGPQDPAAEDNAALRRAWAEIDALEAKLAAARRTARAIEHRVSDAHGYKLRLTRPGIERLIGMR